MSELHYKSLSEIRSLLAQGEVKAEEAVQACLDRIEATDHKVKAFLRVFDEQSLAQARAMDAKGPSPDAPLWGVPLGVKDILATKGLVTTCGSKMLENFKPFYESTVTARLRQAGAILIGKLNMDEFAMGSSTENSAFGPTYNPWDLERIPGGSSGGSAASVAAGQCFGSIGTDTGGSIRQPSAMCGCVGFKPTYGRVSRYGLVAFASSLDQAGPITRSVEDSALLLQTISGHDPKDSTCADREVPDFTARARSRSDLKGVRVGLPKEFWSMGGLDPDVKAVLEKGLEKTRELGAELVEISLPHTEYAIATYYIIAMAEASSNLARFDGVRYGFRDDPVQDLMEMYVNTRTKGFGDEVQRRIMIGSYVLSAGYYDAYYRKAAQVRRLLVSDFEQAFDKCDLVFGGTTPEIAWKIGELVSDPLQMYLQDIFTSLVNLAGLPSLSLPAGLGPDTGMPVGLQIIGPRFGEGRILAAANALEQAIGPLGPPAGL